MVFVSIIEASFRLALTHRSYAQNTGDLQHHNERLEFLGDAILGVIVTDYLYHHFPDLEIGKLAPLRDWLISDSNLLEFANRIGLRDFVLLGQNEILNRVREKSKKPFADAFEALLGAVYLDCDFAIAKDWLIKYFLTPQLQLKLKNIDRNQPQQQLEFLGNAILKAIATNYLYLHFPDLNESNLTYFRQILICRHNLVKFEHQIKQDEFTSPADTLKTLLGTIYLWQSFSHTYT